MSRDAFAESIGVEEATVTRYINGTRVPRREIMTKITAVTAGDVTANDFFPQPVDSATGNGRAA